MKLFLFRLEKIANALDQEGEFRHANFIDAFINKLANKPTPTNKSLWEKAKAEAKKKFRVYPSAYANAWAAKWYKEKGGSWKNKKASKSMKGGLGKWFNEEWVDISRKVDGKHPPCGRKKSKPGSYPKCRPKSEAKTMSASEKDKAVREKRKEERKKPKKGKGNKPTPKSHKKRD